jgi:hypothetical protein
VSGDNKKSLAQKLDELVKAFGRTGIKVSHIEARLGHPLKDSLPEEYTDLAQIYTSIKDGMSHASDWFAVAKSTGASEVAQNLTAEFKGEAAEQSGEDQKTLV